MKKSSRILALALVLVMLFSLAQAAAAEEKVKLRFMSGLWDTTRTAVHENIKRAAEEQFPNVEVEYELTGTSGDWLNKLKTYNATGDMPDVFFMAGSVSFPIINAGNAVDLKSYVDADGYLAATYPDETAAGVNADGTLYALSEGLDYYYNPMLFYNKDIFEKVGISVPTNWDELLAACEQLKNAGYIPLVMGDKDSSSFTYYFAQMIMMLDDPAAVDTIINGGGTWDNPVAVNAFNRISDLVKKGYFPDDITSLDYGAAMELFTSEQAAIYIQMSWEAGNMSQYPFVDFMLWPQINPEVDPKDVTITWAAPNAGYAVYSKTADVELAVKFAEMCAYQAAFGAATDLAQASIVMTGVDVSDKLSDLSRRNLEIFNAAPIKQYPFGNFNFSSKMFAEFGKLGSQLLTGQYTGEQFAADIASAWATNEADKSMG